MLGRGKMYVRECVGGWVLGWVWCGRVWCGRMYVKGGCWRMGVVGCGVGMFERCVGCLAVH